MLTAHKIKILQSLDRKKFRQKYNLFLVEGNKTILELRHSPFKVKEIFTTRPLEISFPDVPVTEITPAELRKISFLVNPKDSIAVCEIPDPTENHADIEIVLDGLQDPGNLGTIIRLADWFGIEQIICSPETVDVFNPKVVQASMGSFTRVNVVYKDLGFLASDTTKKVLAADMDGHNIYDFKFPGKFYLVLGNEGNGLQQNIIQQADEIISIPRFGKVQATESLNVSMAAGIILSQIFSKK